MASLCHCCHASLQLMPILQILVITGFFFCLCLHLRRSSPLNRPSSSDLLHHEVHTVSIWAIVSILFCKCWRNHDGFRPRLRCWTPWNAGHPVLLVRLLPDVSTSSRPRLEQHRWSTLPDSAAKVLLSTLLQRSAHLLVDYLSLGTHNLPALPHKQRARNLCLQHFPSLHQTMDSSIRCLLPSHGGIQHLVYSVH